MKKWIVVFVCILLPLLAWTQDKGDFDRYYLDETMRVDFYLTGDAQDETVTLDEIYRQGAWAGDPHHLIDDFIKGAYFIKVYDVPSNKLIFSRGFDCVFSEYKTTDPALKGIKRTYHHSALFPVPRNPVRFVLERGDRHNIYHPIFVQEIDPESIQVRKEGAPAGVRVYRALENGDPHSSVDLAWIAEGYKADEYDKFTKDVDRFIKVLFSYAPYSKHRKDFNVYGLFVASSQSGVDEPRKGIFVNSAVNGSFNAFGISRYLLTEDNRTFRNIAAAVPYDAIVIMVNSDRYGGGGIYNFYGLSTVDNERSTKVFVHEFGHSFAGLADEYYTSDVAYNEFYPKGVEPAEPNITALLDPKNVKWKDMLSPGIGIPTDWGKEEVEAMQTEADSLRHQMAALKASGKMEEMESVRKKIQVLYAKISAVRQENLERYEGRVGAFEGAGYSSRGLYRPEIECLMFSNSKDHFCKVCQRAIERMINFYCK